MNLFTNHCSKDIREYFNSSYDSANLLNQPPILSVEGNVVAVIFNFLLSEEDPERIKLMKKAISVLSKYIYISCTKLIIDQIQRKEQTDLLQLKEMITCYIKTTLNNSSCEIGRASCRERV